MKSRLIVAAGSALGLVGTLIGVAHAQAYDYTITASDTIPVFENGAASLKSNGLAVMNVAVPWLAGALIALTIVYIFYRVFRHFRA